MSDINEQAPGSYDRAHNEQTEPSVEPTARAPRRNWFVIAVMALALIGMITVVFHTAHQRNSPHGLMIGDVAGKDAPDFELKEVGTGKIMRLSDLRGKAVVLDFWATWCPPCKAEIPSLVDLQKQYGPDGLAIVGVTMDDPSEQEVSKFAQDMGINYTLVLGTENVGDTYSVDSYPTTFYLGRDGKVVDRDDGLSSHHDIESNIRAALAQGEPIEQHASAVTAGAVR